MFINWFMSHDPTKNPMTQILVITHRLGTTGQIIRIYHTSYLVLRFVTRSYYFYFTFDISRRIVKACKL